MNSNHTISIALVTRNRPKSLERWLISIRAQSFQPFEIFISDDSDVENEILNKQLAEKYEAKYVRGPHNGLYANRNNAFKNCSGTHILSADDDHTHPENFIEILYQNIQKFPELIWVLSEKLPDNLGSQLICPAEINWSGLAGKTPNNPEDCMSIACGATLYPRKIFDLGLKYPDEYKFGHIWYLWGVMLHQKGFRISFLPNTFVIHHWKETVEIKRAYDTQFIADYLEANFFVSLTYNACFKKSFSLLTFQLLYCFRLLFIKSTIESYAVKTTITFKQLWQLIKHVNKFKNEWQ